jgi:hypothetical protein
MNTDGSDAPVGSESDSLDLDSRASKVHQQTEPQASRAQVVHALSDMNVVDGPHGLELDKDQLLHQEVSYVLANDDPIIANGHRILLLDIESGLSQLVRESVS